MVENDKTIDFKEAKEIMGQESKKIRIMRDQNLRKRGKTEKYLNRVDGKISRDLKFEI